MPLLVVVVVVVVVVAAGLDVQRRHPSRRALTSGGTSPPNIATQSTWAFVERSVGLVTVAGQS
jgi:hypothetical protein